MTPGATSLVSRSWRPCASDLTHNAPPTVPESLLTRAPFARPSPLSPSHRAGALLLHSRVCQKGTSPQLLFPGLGCAFAWPRHGPAKDPSPLYRWDTHGPEGRCTLPGATWQGWSQEDQSPLVWAPSPAPHPRSPGPHPPPSCRCLIQACGKRMGRGGGRGQGRSLMLLGTASCCRCASRLLPPRI